MGSQRRRRDSEGSNGGHNRRGSSSGGGGGGGDDFDHASTPPRNRERRERDKKTMLSRALQKANTAVLLDNAQNFEGAMEAYEDACRLLTEVMLRSTGEDDRRRLDAIVSISPDSIVKRGEITGFGSVASRD